MTSAAAADAVLFDMDGVVVDSERYWVDLEEGEIFPDTVEGDVSAAEITGMAVEDVYDYLDAHYWTTVDRAGFLDRYDEAARELYTERASLMDGFHDLLADLRAAGRDLALVTSSPPHWIDLVFDRFDLAGAFDTVVSAREFDGPGKPAPDIYRHAADAMGVDPARCVAVEDSTHGAAAAVDAGMACVGYTGASDDPADLSRADAVVADPGTLRAKLLSG